MKSVLLFLSLTLYSALAFTQDCASVTVTGGNGQINISGLAGAPIAGVQVFNSSWASVFNQTYTNPSGNVTVSPLVAGQYFVNVRFYNDSWAITCEKGVNATVTTGSPQPTDTCGATFQKTIGSLQGDDEAFNIAKSADGGYIVVGHSAASGTTNHDGMVMKFDSKGSLLWSKTLGGAQEDYLSQIVATTDGGCVISGATNTNGVGTYTGDCWLIRLDAGGNIVWQKRYFINGSAGNISVLTQTSDGGFAFTGTFPYTPGLSDWMVVKIDANGNVLWQRKLGSGNSDGGNGIIEDNHGGAGLVVCGVYYGSSWYDAVISKLDLVTGNLVWTKTYDFDSRSNWVGNGYKVSDGFVFNTLNVDGFGFENARGGIFKTDFNGNAIWMKEFPMPNCRDVRTVVLPDESFMMVQGEVPHDAAADLNFIRIDKNGNIMWAKKYPRAGAQWMWGMIADGYSAVGAGMATSGSYNDVLLGRIDQNGKMGTCSSQNVTVTPRNTVITPINFSWPVNTALNLSTANTTYTATTTNPVENVLCSDGCPTITVSNVTVNENAGNAVLQVCIPAPAANTLVYSYTTSNGSAISDADYIGGAGTVTISAGQTCGTITIPILNDANVESAENFTVSVGSVTGTVTINDDDQALNTCSSVTITPGSNQVTITGVTAPVATVQVFNSSWASVFNQTYTNAPGTVTVNIGPGTYLVKVTFYTANWAYVCDKSENVTVVNNCPAGTICVSNTCPSPTVNLNTAYSIPNLPAGTTVSWHTGTPATDANKMTPEQAQNVSVSGTYYAAINISGAGCYSATIPVTVTIVPCSSGEVVSSATEMVQLKTDMAAARSITAFPNPFTRSVRVIIDSERAKKKQRSRWWICREGN